jgi:hypothetical protein
LQRNLLLISVLLLALVGCAANDHQQCGKQGLNQLIATTDVSKLFNDIAADFCPSNCTNHIANGSNTCQDDSLSRLVLVPDFVSVSNYTPGTAGLYMGEQMRAALSQRCNSRIYQAEFGRDLKLSVEGLVALTRNPGEIVKDEFRGQDILIGTYAYSGNRLSLFARKINSTNGVISKMVSREIDYSCGAMGTSATVNR